MNRVLSLTLLLAICQAEAQQAVSDALEEVVVRVERPLGVVRAEAKIAERNLYDAFNAFLADPEFEIECYEVTPIGSHIEHDVCEPAFVRDSRRRSTQRAFDLGAVDHVNENLNFALLRLSENTATETIDDNDRLLARMVIAVNDDAAVRRAFLDYLQKRQVLDVALESEPRRRRRR